MSTILDIETLAQPTEKILANLPPWDEVEARQRVPKNYKKEEAISGWLNEDRENHGKNAIEKAALNPETATIAIVGFWKYGKVEQLVCDDEASESDIIYGAFDRISDGSTVLGWNLIGFDMKMLIRRAWTLGVKVPRSIFNPISRYPTPDRFVDMMDKYRAGSFKDPFTRLSGALRAMQLPDKGDGKEFGKLWESDRAKALDYNAQELHGQAELYRRMGVDL